MPSWFYLPVVVYSQIHQYEKQKHVYVCNEHILNIYVLQYDFHFIKHHDFNCNRTFSCAQACSVDQGSPTFLKLRATSCVPINAKGY